MSAYCKCQVGHSAVASRQAPLGEGKSIWLSSCIGSGGLSVTTLFMSPASKYRVSPGMSNFIANISLMMGSSDGQSLPLCPIIASQKLFLNRRIIT